MGENFLSPTEIVAKYPNIPFDAQFLGRLFKLKLLRGKVKDKVSLIEEDSLIELIDLRNENIKSDLIIIKK
jgi:hypothetical protein